MNPDRMLRIALTELRRNPKLQQCDPYSFMGAIVQAAQLGLEPGSGLGHCYLIPYGAECTLVTGFRGKIELALRSGRVKKIVARLVREGDEFKHVLGLNEDLTHSPGKERGEVTHGYAIGWLLDGTPVFDVMTRAEIERVRSLAKRPNPVWETHWDEMARKTCVHRLSKYLPQSPELARSAELDNDADEGKSQHLHEIIDANHIVVSQDAATIADSNAAAKAETAVSELTKLRELVKKKAMSVLDSGVEGQSKCQKAGIGDLTDFDAMDEKKLLAIYEVIK